MRVEDINIRQVLTSKLQRTVEIEIKTKNLSREGISGVRTSTSQLTSVKSEATWRLPSRLHF